MAQLAAKEQELGRSEPGTAMVRSATDEQMRATRSNVNRGLGTITGRDDILRTLKAAEPALRERGVMHAALFGSVVRDEGRPDSDIDILVDLDEEIVRTIYDYAGVKSYIADMFGCPVDVVDRAGLKSHVRPSATAEAVYAF